MAYGTIRGAALPANLPAALNAFDKLIAGHNDIVTRQFSKIDSIKSTKPQNDISSMVEYCERVADAFRDVKPDSAVVWFRRGEALAAESGDRMAAMRMHLKTLEECMELGMSKYSLDELYAIEVAGLPEELHAVYFEEGCRILSFCAWCTPVPEMRAEYIRRALSFYDGLNHAAITHGTPRCHFHKAWYAFYREDVTELLDNVRYLLDNQELSDIYLSQAAMIAGTFYLKRDNLERAMYYMLIAAISDLTAGRLQSPAIEDLSGLLYDTGDLLRASRCLEVAVKNASLTGAKMRMMTVVQHMSPIIDASRDSDRRDIERQRICNWILLGIILLLIVVCIVLLLRIRMIRKLNGRLRASTHDHDIFAARFLELGSMNLEKLGEFQRMALRKLKAAQYADLSEVIQSGAILEEQTARFYDVFDDCFLHVYPDFVAEINRQLRDDAQLTLPAAGKLNAELRILALICLGIDDSSLIARYLGLSLNTVYTYRNRMRGRAVNRDSFERDVMMLGQTDVKPDANGE